MADIEGVTPDLPITFFQRVAYPNAVEAYQVDSACDYSHASEASDEPLIVVLLTKCINDLRIPIPQVTLKPVIKFCFQALSYPIKKVLPIIVFLFLPTIITVRAVFN